MYVVRPEPPIWFHHSCPAQRSGSDLSHYIMQRCGADNVGRTIEGTRIKDDAATNGSGRGRIGTKEHSNRHQKLLDPTYILAAQLEVEIEREPGCF
jgi:hypothetical protein